MLSTKLKEAAGNSADATLYVDDVFSTYLYTGTGATQTITNGIDLAGKGGMVWIKGRTDSIDTHVLQDTINGNNYLSSDTTDPAQINYNNVTAFNSAGFSIGAASRVSSEGVNFVSWTFREAAKFFDVVTYTGTGSARTIAHSLGSAPGMVIVKRTDTTGNWQVYSNGLTSAAYSIQLNQTAAQGSAPTVWNSTAPTSSVFSVGTDASVNASGGTYVAYLYAHDTSSTGIIQCGSFTVDGSNNASVNLGWESQYVMYKRVNSIGQWYVDDVMRGLYAPSLAGNNLFPNLTNAESVGNGSLFLNSTGFTNNPVGNYVSGDTVIYMAIRRPNKPPTTGTQVFLPIAYTGNNTSQTLTTGFATDAAFIVRRNTDPASGDARDRNLVDKLRGTTQDLFPNKTSAESAYFGSGQVVYNNTQVLLNFGGDGPTNKTGGDFVLEAFRRAPGFFDEVCYTGTGSATTQAHNLTVAPEMMIVKERSAVNNWWVYDAIDGNTKYSVLNSTAIPVTSSTAWNNTTPTASVFSIGTGANVNASAQTFVAYLFATLAGISKVGSYTGNGTGQAIACGFSAGARFVLIKRTDSTGNWYTFDSARGLTSGSSPYLLLNSTAAEVTGNNGVYASTGGFTLGATAITTTNIATATYIFLAVA